MRGRILFILTISLILITMPFSPASSSPVIFDADDARYIDEGFDILTIDYILVTDNLVTDTGFDYPYGKIWIILYEPEPYENLDLMEEENWDRSHELARIELPGPSGFDRWSDGDEVIFSNLGIYEWGGNSFDRVVFRIFVEEPSADIHSQTLMWGTLSETASHHTTYEFNNDCIYIYFRTLDLPEEQLPPMVSIQDIWLEHNVKVGGFDGLRVHMKFQADNMRAQTCRIAAYFHYDNNSESVACGIDDPAYSTPTGNLTIQKDFIPIYPATIFSDFTMFIPYEAFPFSDDYIDYHVNIEVLDSGWKYIGSGQSPVFSVMRPEETY